MQNRMKCYASTKLVALHLLSIFLTPHKIFVQCFTQYSPGNIPRNTQIKAQHFLNGPGFYDLNTLSQSKSYRLTKTLNFAASVSEENDPHQEALVVSLVPSKEMSPYGDTWEAVFQHMAQKLQWIDRSYQLKVFTDEVVRNSTMMQEFTHQMKDADIFVGASIQNAAVADVVEKLVLDIDTRAMFDCTKNLQSFSRVGQFSPTGGLLDNLAGLLFAREDRELYLDLQRFYERYTSDDLQYLLLLLINRFVMSVPLVAGGISGGKGVLDCMLTNCKDEVINCMKDGTCRQAVAALAKCPPNDQVCAYRAIVSFESKELEQFSLCILQKHNCLCNTAEIQMEPDTAPLATFRGQPLTRETAEDIFIGSLDKLPWSWKVVCGQNPAYDFFPCQHQIFYRARAQGNMWYDPVFKVQTLDGREVWRRRHYKVRRGPKVGTFYFSVLDNGVTSEEFWKIIDCADDISWGIFAYQGAAAAAGQSYGGSLLVTPDGHWPANDQMERIIASFDRAGIKMWELYDVNNSLDSSDAPLGIPEEFNKYNDFLAAK